MSAVGGDERFIEFPVLDLIGTSASTLAASFHREAEVLSIRAAANSPL